MPAGYNPNRLLSKLQLNNPYSAYKNFTGKSDLRQEFDMFVNLR